MTSTGELLTKVLARITQRLRKHPHEPVQIARLDLLPIIFPPHLFRTDAFSHSKPSASDVVISEMSLIRHHGINGLISRQELPVTIDNRPALRL